MGSAFGAANAAGILMTASIFGAAFFFAQYLQAGLGEDPLTAGLRMLPWTATLFLVAPVAGRLVNRLGERLLVMAGLAAQAAGFAWMAGTAGHGYPAMVPAMVFAGVGVSTAKPAVQTATVGAAPPSAIGKASGVYNAMRQLGGAFGIAILSAVFTAHGGFTSVTAIGHGFRAAMIVATAVSAAGALAGAGLTRRRSAAPAGLASDDLLSPYPNGRDWPRNGTGHHDLHASRQGGMASARACRRAASEGGRRRRTARSWPRRAASGGRP